ncbi:MAG TPA: cation transporter, partial [Burkholderiaceae bacterium]|nr:cation transporter [Burkholderiaceae bacterium]
MTHLDHDHRPRAHAQAHGDACCAPATGSGGGTARVAGTGWLHVPSMDCAAEETQIRRALDALPGVRSLTFRLAERRLRVDAEPAVVDEAAALLRRIGFSATPVAAQVTTAAATGHADDHTGGKLHAGAWPLGLALALAIAAEALDVLAPATRPWQVVGFLVAGGAIALAGVEVYR